MDVRLTIDDDGLVLTDGALELRPGFSHLVRRARPGAVERELVVRAVRVKGLVASETRVLDATAGLGEDSFLLASAGFSVDLYERDPTIAALLADALERAAAAPQLSSAAARLRLHEADSIEVMSTGSCEPPDVVLLDPMFPARSKSAAVGKKFQLLHAIERPCADEEALFAAAESARPRKIVVKRPLKGPWLAGRKPGYSLEGRAVRYDCYVFARRGTAAGSSAGE